MSTNGRFGYFSSGGDLWLVTPLPKAAAPLPMRVITGKLTASNGRPIKQARILIKNRIGDTISTLNVDPVTGGYSVVLPEGVEYEGVVVDENNYYAPMKLDLNTNMAGLSEQQDDIVMISEAELDNGTFTFRNLNFDTGKFDLKPEAIPELNRWANLIQQHNLQVSIEGHTDNIGSAQDNLTLSRNRAKTARDYLLSRGCHPERISAEGYGATRPQTDNQTSEGRLQNRRVELKVTRK